MGRKIALSVDHEVGMAPVVEGVVGGHGRISFPDGAEARRFAASLRSGPLPAKLSLVSEERPPPR
jgi:preprotein translocase subunit SecD